MMTSTTAQIYQTDRGTDFLNSTFKNFYAKEGITFETSAAYTPQQNGVTKTIEPTMKEKTRTILAHVPAQFSLSEGGKRDSMSDSR